MQRLVTATGLVVVTRTAGILWAVVFAVVGVGAGLQLFADGSLFSYAIADRASWGFHFHNIPTRLTVHLLTHIPAEAYVGLTGDGAGGIRIYGLLFFAAPLAGLALTWALDRSEGRALTTVACAPTACLDPLVFGFPTEMWLSQSLVWPAFAAVHGTGLRFRGGALVFVLLLLLGLTHEAGLVYAVVVAATAAIWGLTSPRFLWAATALGGVCAMWMGLKVWLRPDAYFAEVYVRSALGFVDPSVVTTPIVLLLAATLAGFGVAIAIVRHLGVHKAALWAALGVAVVLGFYWMMLDTALHAAERYGVRSLLVPATVLWVVAAVVFTSPARGGSGLFGGRLGRIAVAMRGPGAVYTMLGGLALVTLVHAVETAKFVHGWDAYEQGVRELAMGAHSDAKLGDERFVDAERLGRSLNRWSWYSTTHYLSVLLAPGFRPDRLVVDADAGYYWLSCAMARASEAGASAIPLESRRLVRVLACLKRPD